MRRLVQLILCMILVPTLVFAGSIRMSVKDAATGEEKVIMDQQVNPDSYYEQGSVQTVSPSEAGGSSSWDRERKKLETELERARKHKERADKKALKAIKSGNQKKMLDAIFEQKKAQREVDAAERAVYGNAYVDKKVDQRKAKHEALEREQRLRDIENKQRKLEKTQKDTEQKQGDLERKQRGLEQDQWNLEHGY